MCCQMRGNVLRRKPSGTVVPVGRRRCVINSFDLRQVIHHHLELRRNEMRKKFKETNRIASAEREMKHRNAMVNGSLVIAFGLEVDLA